MEMIHINLLGIIFFLIIRKFVRTNAMLFFCIKTSLSDVATGNEYICYSLPVDVTNLQVEKFIAADKGKFTYDGDTIRRVVGSYLQLARRQDTYFNEFLKSVLSGEWEQYRNEESNIVISYICRVTVIHQTRGPPAQPP